MTAGAMMTMINLLRSLQTMKLPYLYHIKYRVRITLGLYGYVYNVHHNHGEVPWPWWKYLFSDLAQVPMGVRGFMHYNDALQYLLTSKHLGLYISKDRYIP